MLERQKHQISPTLKKILQRGGKPLHFHLEKIRPIKDLTHVDKVGELGQSTKS